jgi:iron complex outermembrane receptor protein
MKTLKFAPPIKSLPYILSLFISTGLIAQTSISGKVSDAATGKALTGANVTVEGTYIGSTSDDNGRFSLNTSHPTPFILTFSFIGYESQHVEVTGSQPELNISLNTRPVGANTVIVTAQLREQELQDVPMAVSVLDEQLLRRSSEMKNIGDVSAYTPGLGGKNNATGQGWFTIRGLGTNSSIPGAEASIGVFHDGVYFGRTNWHGVGFFDVGRIEVLKGPQNTLFGRNASAGAISIHSHNPGFQKQIGISLAAGNEGQLKTDYILNFPFSDKLAVRLAGIWQQRDGVRTITNLNNREVGKLDNFANRLSFLYRPTSNFNALLKVVHHDYNSNGWSLKATNPDIGATPDKFEREFESDYSGITPTDRNKALSGTLDLNWVLNPNLLLKSQTIVSRVKMAWEHDVDASPTYVLSFKNPAEARYVSQEFRLNGQSERLNWLLAASGYTEEIDMDFELLFSDANIAALFELPEDFCDQADCREFANELSRNQGDYQTLAFYGNLNYGLTDRLGITAGLRYTIDKKKFYTKMDLGTGAVHQATGGNILGSTGEVTSEEAWTGLTPRLTIDYSLAKGTRIYGGYSRGYKAGGFNNYTANPFNEEINNAYEVGLKSSFTNNRGKFNASVYLYDYKDLQVESIVNAIIEISNAASVESKGIEVETAFEVVRGLQIVANAAYNKAEFKEYVVANQDFSGNVPPRSPQWMFNGILQYVKPVGRFGNFVLRADYVYQSKEFHTRDNFDEMASAPYSLVNGSVGLENLFNRGIDITAFGANLLNEEYIVLSDNVIGTGPSYVRGFPRTVGLKVNVNNFLTMK